jgi:hypothetical protein
LNKYKGGETMAPIELTSIDIGRAALKMAVTENRAEEQALRQQLMEQQGIQTVAIDFGGEFVPSVKKIIERAVVAAQRQGLVPSNHVGEGAVAGAVRAALGQISSRSDLSGNRRAEPERSGCGAGPSVPAGIIVHAFAGYGLRLVLPLPAAGAAAAAA